MVEASTRMKLTPNKRLELTSAAWRDGAALAVQPRCWTDLTETETPVDADAIPVAPGFEERRAGLISVLLNLPSYLLAFSAPMLIAGATGVDESLPVIVVCTLVMGPLLTLSAVGHAMWATRSARVSRRARRAAWVTTAFGGVALLIGILPIMRALSRL